MKYLKYFIIIVSIFLSSPLIAKPAYHYHIFIDAGSSGSRLHIFEYEKKLSMPVVKDVFSTTTKPGLSDFADNPRAASASLKKILDDASQFLVSKEENLSTIPINIFATAGMRLISEEKQQRIYANIRDFLKNNYSFSIEEIKTINGRMEALYGWLDVNYLLKNFQNHTATVGSIDMGGASTQIAFAIKDKTPSEDSIKLSVNHIHYTILSKSFLGLGQDQARINISSNQQGNTCFPSHYPLSQEMIGNYNMTSCGMLYTDLIQKAGVPQAVSGVDTQTFIAYSGIYYTYNFFNIDKTPDSYSLQAQLENVCARTWEQLQKDYPKVPEKYLATYCANGIYQGKLLYDTYHISAKRLIVTNQINDNDIDWTLGAALFKLIENDLIA